MKNKSIILGVIPLIIILGVVLFGDRKYNLISAIIAITACIPVFLKYERAKESVREFVVIAVMTALTVAGRFAFAATAGFKPVTAIVVITAIYLGSDAGFITGAMSAVLSNIYFGQGPWTPFQMFVWGSIGFAAGIISEKTEWFENRAFLYIFGMVSGIAFSLMMDIWTVVSADGSFNFSRYIAAVAASGYFMIIYAVSNVIFFMLLEKPIGKKLRRIKMKYIS